MRSWRWREGGQGALVRRKDEGLRAHHSTSWGDHHVDTVAAWRSAQYVARQSWTRRGTGLAGESQPKLMPEECRGNADGARYRPASQETARARFSRVLVLAARGR